VEQEGDSGFTSDDPGGTEIAIDHHRMGTAGPVEPFSDSSGSAVDRLRSHALTGQVGVHDDVGCEQRQQLGDLAATSRGYERADDPSVLLRCSPLRSRLRRSPKLAPSAAGELSYRSVRTS
jgi:hypothetical protein